MLRPRIHATTDHFFSDDLPCSDGQISHESDPLFLTNESQPPQAPARSFRYSIVAANGKSKLYSTRRSAAWKSVSSHRSTFQGSRYGAA